MKNKVLSVLREYLGEEETLLDAQTMHFLVEGMNTEDEGKRFEFALYTNLLIEIKTNYYNLYPKFQYYLTNDNSCSQTACITILNSIPYKTKELLRIENLLINLM